MTTHVHKLEGCSPTPLAHYLKALAVLRLLAEQRDPDARGWWREQSFWLSTSLNRDELLDFFVISYQPSPILSPWNAGSGFYFRESKVEPTEDGTAGAGGAAMRDKPTAATRAVDQLLAGTEPRLAAYRDAATTARALLRDLGLDEAPTGDAKARLIARLRSALPEPAIRWTDAAVTSSGDDFDCAPLAGSGGNDGNEEFSKQFLERVLTLVAAAPSVHRPLLESSLFATPAPAAHDTLAGQFFPAGNGGTNAGRGFQGKAVANSWDYLFAVEGSIAFGGAAARRLDASISGAAFPFAVRVDAVGYQSAADSDRDGSRSEIWLPIWAEPSSLAGVQALLGEGRVRVDRADAHRTTDVVRSISSLGVSRGVPAFERTVFLTRNGNMHYSAPAGRWQVAAEERIGLLDDIVPWVRVFSAFARDKHAAKAASSVARRIDECILAVCRSGGEAARWQALLIALGDAESALLRSPSKAGDPKKRLSPLPSLRPAWLLAADDGSCELRLAAALASQEVALRDHGREFFANVRSHWMPLDRSFGARRPLHERPRSRFATGASGLASDPDVVGTGADLERDCVALLRRRALIAPTLSRRGLGLIHPRGAGAALGDVAAFLARQVDDARILAIARPLMAIDWRAKDRPRLAAPATSMVDAVNGVFRLALRDPPIVDGEPLPIAFDAEPIARLAAGDLAGAIAICLRRLRASGLSPTIRLVAGDERAARRLLASLAFPLRAADAKRLADRVTRSHHPEEDRP